MLALAIADSGMRNADVEPENFLVYADNWLAVQVFVALARCWRVDSMNGHYHGLIRAEIVSTLGLLGVKPNQHCGVFNDLQVMEAAALEVLNKS